MTSGDLGLTEGLVQEINEELDLAELFLYNSPMEDFPSGCDKGAFLQDDHQQLPMVNHYTYMSPSNPLASSQDLSTTEHLSAAALNSSGMVSRPQTIRGASPRIEITPSSESVTSQNLAHDLVTKALGTYRDCVSPASSNSSSGWPAEVYSPAASPCVSPPSRGPGMGLSDLDLCLAMQDIHTSSAHSSPGASPRNSFAEEAFLQPHHRSATSVPHQRSRSAPPYGKRAHEHNHSCQGGTPVKQRSRSPSPIPLSHEQRGSYSFSQYQAQALASSLSVDMLSSAICNLSSATSSAMLKQAQNTDRLYVEGYDWATGQQRIDKGATDVKSENFYMFPTTWPVLQPVHHGAFGGLPLVPFPSLEWPLSSKSGPYELLIQHQPRSHHRAQYETEGSRGAVKTSNGGHPEVQLLGYQGPAPLGLQVFIGTADERVLKPHAFYQVHRVTGKTVATPSMERMMNGTKVLEIPLEPKKHMKVVIDCVGILKLRNADIELRNGETDIGRKNTRVRLVFRVHIPQPGGQLVSLQVASDPIECSQRSAQELPAVERQDLDQCSVLGGQQMVLTGQNFTSDSKVIFSEKTQDGKQIWEVEASVDRDKTQAVSSCSRIKLFHSPKLTANFVNHAGPMWGKYILTLTSLSGFAKPSVFKLFILRPLSPCSPCTDKRKPQKPRTRHSDSLSLSFFEFHTPNMLFLEVPPYRDRTIPQPVKVNFYVINGKKKRSQPQHFIYTPHRAIKAEPLDDCHFNAYGCSDSPSLFEVTAHHLEQDGNLKAFNISPSLYHLTTVEPRAHMLTPDPLENQVYSQSRPGTLINSPVYYSSFGPTHVDGSLDASESAPSLGHYVPAGLPVAKQLDGPHEPLLLRREGFVQKASLLGKSPPTGHVHDQAEGEGRGDQDQQTPEKQKGLRHAYLEDVNDIIRRDLRGHSGQ